MLPALPSLSEIEAAARIVHDAMAPTAQHAWPLLAHRLTLRLRFFQIKLQTLTHMLSKGQRN